MQSDGPHSESAPQIPLLAEAFLRRRTFIDFGSRRIDLPPDFRAAELFRHVQVLYVDNKFDSFHSTLSTFGPKQLPEKQFLCAHSKLLRPFAVHQIYSVALTNPSSPLHRLFSTCYVSAYFRFVLTNVYHPQ